jgi:hypothetical protein
MLGSARPSAWGGRALPSAKADPVTDNAALVTNDADPNPKILDPNARIAAPDTGRPDPGILLAGPPTYAE